MNILQSSICVAGREVSPICNPAQLRRRAYRAVFWYNATVVIGCVMPYPRTEDEMRQDGEVHAEWQAKGG